MIKSLTVTNTLGEYLTIELFNPWKTGIGVKSIGGLGTPKYEVNTTPYASGDGSIIGSVIASTREIPMVFYPMATDTQTVEDSRQLLYRYFQVKKQVTVAFELDNRIVSIDGFVEENDPDIFSERETISISMICPDPYFRENFASAQFFYGEQPMFEFPFSNESTTENLLEMGRLTLDNRVTIPYNAEIDAGLLIVIDCYSDPGDIVIYNIDTLNRISISTERVRLITGKKLSEKDQILISTYSGDKYIQLLREGRYYNILGAANKNLDWFKLQQGPNSYTYTTGEEHANVVIAFRYRNTYASI